MGTTCLVEVYHLVVLQDVKTVVEVVGLVLAVRDDMAEKSHGFIALPDPKGTADGFHVHDTAGTVDTKQ